MFTFIPRRDRLPTMLRRSYRFLLVFVFPCLLLAQTALQKDQVAPDSQKDLAAGKRLFEGQCARCHGIGGTGGQGPSLTRPRLRHAVDDADVFSLIRNGIPGTGMPQIWTLNDREIWQVVGYIRSLGRTVPVALPGDPAKGKVIYESKGGCANCHIVSGQGGNLGPDLTEIGARRGAVYLRAALVDPGAAMPEGLLTDYAIGYSEFLPTHVVTRDGREVKGLRVNEDTFTVQIRDLDRFYSFRKADLKELNKEFGKSPMPSYETKLSSSEIDDLVAYLASLRGNP
jgi:cytochrome c oxidase cbb3-type subunit 3